MSIEARRVSPWTADRPLAFTEEDRHEMRVFVAPLLTLLVDFESGRVDPDTFGRRFTREFSQLRGIPSAEVAAAMDRLFFDVRDFRDPDFPDDPSRVLTEDQLRSRITQFLDTCGVVR